VGGRAVDRAQHLRDRFRRRHAADQTLARRIEQADGVGEVGAHIGTDRVAGKQARHRPLRAVARDEQFQLLACPARDRRTEL
jgi:hypothetical protein